MYRKTKKLFAVSLVVTMLLTMTLFSGIASAATALQGSDRYATALNIVKAGWTTSENAVIARGDDLADALAAAPLAFAKGKAPILLTETSALPTGVMEELVALGVKNVYIVGGTGAVSANVETALAAKFTVKRLGGANRAATSLLVANEAFPTAPAKAVLVNGEATADALSVSSAAAYNGMPILLADSADAVAADVAAYLAGKTVYAVGGTGVLSNAVVGSATRLAGDNRYATNVAVLNAFSFDYSKVFVAVGEDSNNVDALGGAAFAAIGNNPMVLVDGALTADQTSLLTAKLTSSSVVYTLGGATPASVAAAIEAIVNGIEFKVKSVTANNLKEVTIVFTQDVNMAASTEANYATSALNPANYSPAGTLTKVDNRTVVLAFTTPATKGAAVSVTVNNVKNTGLTKTIPYFATAYVAADSVAPTATASVDVNKLLTITFSEPMTSAGNVYVGGTLTSVSLSGKKATATLGSAFEAGKSYNVVIVGAQDLAGNYIAPNPTTLGITMVNDTVKPTVVSVTPTANATKLEVKFAEALKDQGTAPAVNYATLTFKDPAGNVVGSAVTVDTPVADTDNLVYSAAINLLSTYTYRYLDVKVSGYKDLAGNAGDDATVRVLLQQDKVAPAYKSVLVASDNKSIIVNFDEAIAAGSAATGGLVVSYTNNDGIVYASETLNVATLVDKDGATSSTPTAVKVAPTSWLNTDSTLKSGTYTITVKAAAVEDAYTNETSTDITVPVVVGTATSSDSTAPVLSTADFVTGSIKVIQITSDEDLSAPVLSNITLDGAAMPTGTKVYLYNNKKTVRIELPSDSITLDGIRVLSYKLSDLAGNTTTKTVALDFDENVRPYVTSAVLSDPTNVVLTVSESVSGTSYGDDFEVYVNGVKATLGTTPVTVSGTKVTVTLNSAVALADTLTVKVVGSDLKDANGNTLVSGGTFTVTR